MQQMEWDQGGRLRFWVDSFIYKIQYEKNNSAYNFGY